MHAFRNASASVPSFRLSEDTKFPALILLRLLILKPVRIPFRFSFPFHFYLFKKALSHLIFTRLISYFLIFSIFKAVLPHNPPADTHLYTRYPLAFLPHILSPSVYPRISSSFIRYGYLSISLFPVDNLFKKYLFTLCSGFLLVHILYLVSEAVALPIQIINIFCSFSFAAPPFFPVYLYPSVFPRYFKIIFTYSSPFDPAVCYPLVLLLLLLYPRSAFIPHTAPFYNVRVLPVILR